uniref:Uncharacterized protein n=1 Tax=Steinernema glaseri TaxID=37863 RepID=A0A1I7YUV3_9BILA
MRVRSAVALHNFLRQTGERTKRAKGFFVELTPLGDVGNPIPRAEATVAPSSSPEAMRHFWFAPGDVTEKQPKKGEIASLVRDKHTDVGKRLLDEFMVWAVVGKRDRIKAKWCCVRVIGIVLMLILG